MNNITKQFELTDETKIVSNGGISFCRLYRIRATKDMPWHDVKAGELGGWVESLDNIADEAWVADEAMVCGDATISGRARVFHEARILDEAQVRDEAKVSGCAWVTENAVVSDHAIVEDLANVLHDAIVSGYARISDDAEVSYRAKVGGRAMVFDDACVSGDAEVTGDVWVFGNARVTDDARLCKQAHFLHMCMQTPETFNTTVFRTKSGHQVVIDGKKGTIDDFANMLESGTWHTIINGELDSSREELEALIQMMRIRVARW